MRIEEAKFCLEEGGTRDELTGDSGREEEWTSEDKYFSQI